VGAPVVDRRDGQPQVRGKLGDVQQRLEPQASAGTNSEMIDRSSCEFIPVRCARRSPQPETTGDNSAVSDGRSASGVLEGESDGFRWEDQVS
jgi:hypothetical protein